MGSLLLLKELKSFKGALDSGALFSLTNGRPGTWIPWKWMDGAYQLNVVQNQTKLVTFWGGSDPGAPRKPPGVNFPRYGAPHESGSNHGRTDHFLGGWGSGAPRGPPGANFPQFGSPHRMLQKEPKLRTFRGGREISRAPKCLRAFRPD